MAVRLTRRAAADLADIREYVYTESGSEVAADRAVTNISERFVILSEWPRIGRRRNELRRGLRSHVAGNYLIFYRLTRGDVVVIRILHGRRNLPALFR